MKVTISAMRRFPVSIGLLIVAALVASCSLGSSDPQPSPEPLYITATPGATFTPTLTATTEPVTPTTEVITNTPLPPAETPTATTVFAPTDPQGTLRDSSIGIFMRYTPGTLGEITRVMRGSEAFLLMGRSDNNRWVEVRLADDFTGWLAVEDVATSVDVATLPITGSAEEDTDYVVLVKMDAQDLNLREAPYEFARVIMQLDALTPLRITARLEDNTWYQVATEQGVNGWVSSTFIDVPFDIELVGVVDAPSAVVANVPTSVQPGITGVPLLPTATFVPEGFVSPTPSQIEPTQPAVIQSTGVPGAPPQDGRQAQVKSDSGGLRLRQLPSADGFVLGNLRALNPLTINGRTGDNGWVLVEMPEGYKGWVATSFLDVFIDLNTVPVVSNPQPVEMVILPTPDGAPSVNSGITGGARNIYVRGQQLGNNRNVFTVVGDSISATPYFLREFQYNYNLQEYGYLLPVLQSFSMQSFNNTPLSSYPGWMSWTPLSPDMAPADCGGASPIVCDYTRLKPSIALIMLGTNDARSFISAGEYQANMTRIIEISIEMGVIPVLSTIPPRNDFNDYVLQYNDVVRSLAAAYDVPLWDFYQIVVTLENRGLGEDGVHLSIPPNAPYGTVDFSADNLRYGTTMRNLTALQMLQALLNNVMY